jgi:hypothetical protein
MVCRIHYPGMDVDQAALGVELFAQEVIPRLKEIAG